MTIVERKLQEQFRFARTEGFSDGRNSSTGKIRWQRCRENIPRAA
jgi:hypothetical protein